MTASAWTEDRIDRLRTLWIAGRSAARIARELDHGITRSAVLGKIYRLGLSAGRPPPPKAVVPRVARRRDRRPLATAVLRAASTSLPDHGLATILSVRRCECRWPYGDPGAEGFSLCGRPIARGAFCGPHAAVAYRPVRQTPESLEALAGLQ